MSFQMSLFLSSLPASATEDSIRTRVVKSLSMIQPSSIRSIVHVEKSRWVSPRLVSFWGLLKCLTIQRCAFVNFKDRVSAEQAAEAWANGLDMDGERLGVRWGRGKNGTATEI